MAKGNIKNNQFVAMGVVVSLVVVALSFAYYLLVSLPKQQDITLRKQTYELCLKEINSSRVYTDVGNSLVKQYGLVEGGKEFGVIYNEAVASCVEKRLQEYNK